MTGENGGFSTLGRDQVLHHRRYRCGSDDEFLAVKNRQLRDPGCSHAACLLLPLLHAEGISGHHGRVFRAVLVCIADVWWRIAGGG
jgi:hypothetical protein